jgi:hypothetical protein
MYINRDTHVFKYGCKKVYIVHINIHIYIHMHVYQHVK